LEFANGILELYIEDIIKIIKEINLDKLFGKIIHLILVNGLTVFKMVLEE